MSPLLDGLRIIEGSAFVAAPLGGMTLAQLGARFPRQNEVASLRNKAAALANSERASDGTPRSGGAPSSRQSTAPSLAEPSRAAALVLAALLTLGLPLVLIIAALRPAECRVARAVALQVPMQQVFELLQDFRQWQRWSPWKAFNPALQHSFTGAALGKGAIFNWQDERKNASGYLEIVQAAPPFALAIDANQQRPQPSSALTEFGQLRAAHTESQPLDTGARETFETEANKLLETARRYEKVAGRAASLALGGSSFASANIQMCGVTPSTYRAPVLKYSRGAAA